MSNFDVYLLIYGQITGTALAILIALMLSDARRKKRARRG
jgi:hypothetical protein